MYLTHLLGLGHLCNSRSPLLFKLIILLSALSNSLGLQGLPLVQLSAVNVILSATFLKKAKTPVFILLPTIVLSKYKRFCQGAARPSLPLTLYDARALCVFRQYSVERLSGFLSLPVVFIHSKS